MTESVSQAPSRFRGRIPAAAGSSRSSFFHYTTGFLILPAIIVLRIIFSLPSAGAVPAGAFYALFHRVSLFRITSGRNNCACAKTRKMDADTPKTPNSEHSIAGIA